MKKEVRTICYDEVLKLEAYCLEGIVQPFPNHFHDYYVVGVMKAGQRYLSCKNMEYILRRNDIILFNPEDSHTCAQSGNEALHYLGINISKATMLDLAEEVTGERKLPIFTQTVVSDSELSCYLQPLHEMIMSGSGEFEREELLLLMISLLINRYSKPFNASSLKCLKEIEDTCAFIQEHFEESISLDQLCNCAGLSKSALLRAFSKEKGMTPYRYLQNIRIDASKKLLEQGVPLIEAATQTGFSDQSHFTKFFRLFIGLTPGAYRDNYRNKNYGEHDENEK